MGDNPFRGTPRQKAVDAMSDLELRRRVKILVEQTEREAATPPAALPPGVIGGYLYSVEIFRLLGLAPRPGSVDPVTATDPRKRS